MKIKNPWVGYVSRSYDEIRYSVINALKTKAPEVRDYSESNLLIILVSIFAGVAEMLNYYIDNMAREAFISTTRLYSNMVRHTKLLDYRIKTSLPSSVNLTLVSILNDEPIGIPADYILKAGHQFSSDNGINFILRYDIIWPKGVSAITIPVEQLTLVPSDLLGQANGTANQRLLLPDNYAHNTMSLMIANEPWLLVDTLGYSKPGDRHFIVDVSPAREAYIEFGNDLFGKIPVTGTSIYGTYYTTQGADGQVGPSSITVSVTALSIPNIDEVTVNNIEASSGGYGIQNLEQIRSSLPLSLRTLDRAVTRQDYIDITKLAPGVNKAALFFECGKTVDIYISPVGGGVAQQPLLDSTYDYLYNRKMVTTKIRVFTAGESQIVISAEIWAKFRKDKTATTQAVTNALLEAFSIDSSDINKPIRLSDVISTIDNVEEVDYLKLKTLAIKPFPRPSNHSNLLDWDVEVVNPIIKTVWVIEYSSNGFRLFKNNKFKQNLSVGVWYIDPDAQVNFKLNFSSYSVGDRWTFSTYPVNQDQIIDDYSMPLAKVQNLSLKVYEQIITN